jgi:thiamine transport system ATP-binding protein
LLKITNLQYKYKNTETIYTYNLKVKPKEIVAILGESGSGKSTLLDLISGFLEPDSGSIIFNDKEINPLPIEQRPISILFQNNNLFEHLNVEKNILLGISKHKDNIKKNIQINSILKKVNLESYKDKLALELSGGQQQRVALARVLIRKEPILLLDEPFSGLDEKTRFDMLDLVRQIVLENNLHLIMVTHEIEDCKRIADHIYIMKNNILEEQ